MYEKSETVIGRGREEFRISVHVHVCTIRLCYIKCFVMGNSADTDETAI